MRKIITFYNQLSGDSLYRNSIFLMLSTAVMAFFGFFFWILNARLFLPEQIGIATTLLSVVTLISTFSLLGLGNGLIRFLPTSTQKNEKINTAFTIITIVSVILSVGYLIGVEYFSPKLMFIKENLIFAILFIIFVAFSSLNLISDNLFIAYRSSKYVLVKNSVWSITKLILPIFLITLGAYGIFMSVGIATITAVFLSLFFLISNFEYSFKPVINEDVIKRMIKFALGNHIAVLMGTLPSLILPVIILNYLGAIYAGYFYIDMMIANMLFIIPLAVSQSLFAEGSYSETQLKQQVIKAIKIISLIMIPSIIATIFLGKYILLAFGSQYSNDGIILLQLLAVSGIFLSINYIGNTLLYIKHKIRLLIALNFIVILVILLFSRILIHMNLLGIGIAWIMGQGLTALLYLFLIRHLLFKK